MAAVEMAECQKRLLLGPMPDGFVLFVHECQKRLLLGPMPDGFFLFVHGKVDEEAEWWRGLPWRKRSS